MSTQSIEHESLVREFMRGDRSTFKSGYSAENAAIAVQEMESLGDEERDLLAAYGMGYGDAIKWLRDPRYEPLIEDESEWPEDKRAAYERGHARGLNEAADLQDIQLG